MRRLLILPVLVMLLQFSSKVSASGSADEWNLSAEEAQELSAIEQSDNQFMTSMQAAANAYQTSSTARKQAVFAKACAEAKWPLPKDANDVAGCRADLSRRLVTKGK